MEHVLAVGPDGPATAAFLNELWNEGYRSLFRVDDWQAAQPLLAMFTPDLVVLVPDRKEAAKARPPAWARGAGRGNPTAHPAL